MSENEKEDGLPGYNKALGIILQIAIADLTDEDIEQAYDLYSKSDTTYGLLWGDLTPDGRTRDKLQMDILGCLVDVLKFSKKIAEHPGYRKSVEAGYMKVAGPFDPERLSKATEIARKTIDQFVEMEKKANLWDSIKGLIHQQCPSCGAELSPEDLKNGRCEACIEAGVGHTFHPIRGDHLSNWGDKIYGPAVEYVVRKAKYGSDKEKFHACEVVTALREYGVDIDL